MLVLQVTNTQRQRPGRTQPPPHAAPAGFGFAPLAVVSALPGCYSKCWPSDRGGLAGRCRSLTRPRAPLAWWPALIAPALPSRPAATQRVQHPECALAMAQYPGRAAQRPTTCEPVLLRLSGMAPAGLFTGVLTRPSRFAAWAAVTVAGGLGFLLRFRVSAETTAWCRGARASDAPPATVTRFGRTWTIFHGLDRGQLPRLSRRTHRATHRVHAYISA